MPVVFVNLVRLLAIVIVWSAHAPPLAAQTSNAHIVSAANAFLATLDDAQRRGALFAFDDEQQRKRWSNLPTSIVARTGVAFKDMDTAQRSAAMNLLAAVLSERGLEKVQQIMEADEAFKNLEPARGNRPPPGGPGGPGGAQRAAMFGRDLYYFSILGTPSETAPWMLQFGGHHLAINVTIVADRDVLTPTLTGAQPARFEVRGKIVRPLGRESDQALALLGALDDEQRKQAILTYKVADLVLGPGQDGKTLQPEGLRAAAMTAPQREMLLRLIAEWAGIVNDSAATARMAEIERDLDATWFAWSGATTANAGDNITAYYRISGPKVVIEYAPQQMGGDPADHIHTMYRDPTNDYGRSTSAR